MLVPSNTLPYRACSHDMSGYMHAHYAESLAEFGTPRQLTRCEGWILERRVPGFSYRDASGCYPLFCCKDWSKLHVDLDELADQLVCLSIVSDPFGRCDVVYLQRCFGDVVIPFKEHFVIDLLKPAAAFVSRHHQRYARKALDLLNVQEHPEPSQFLDEWMSLQRTLTTKHRISGIRAYSRRAFAIQLAMPGTVVLRAMDGDRTVGAQIWFVQRDVAYGHVLAFSERGYQLGAAYALYWFAIHHFASRVRWCSIGGVPGVGGHGAEGLTWFKRGWSQETRTAYFCGRIFDRERYAEIGRA